MWKIKLADDTELNIGYCGVSEGIMWIALPELAMMDAFQIFSDKTRTQTIVAYGDVVHEGYTDLIHLSIEYDGGVKVALRKGD